MGGSRALKGVGQACAAVGKGLVRITASCSGRRVVIRQGDEHFSGEHLTRRTHDYHSEVEHGVPFGRGALREDPFGSDRPRSAPRRQQYSQQGQYRQQLQQQRQHLHSSGGRGRQAQRNEPPRVLAFGEGALTKWH